MDFKNRPNILGFKQLAEIKRLRERYIMSYLDKAGQNIAFMCKILYHNLRSKVINDSGQTYSIQPKGAERMAAEFRKAVDFLKMPKSLVIWDIP